MTQIGNAMKVMVHAIFVCKTCGADMTRIGLADRMPDGSVASVAKLAGADTCNDCLRGERGEHDVQLDRARKRKQWAKKRPTLVGDGE